MESCDQVQLLKHDWDRKYALLASIRLVPVILCTFAQVARNSIIYSIIEIIGPEIGCQWF